MHSLACHRNANLLWEDSPLPNIMDKLQIMAMVKLLHDIYQQGNNPHHNLFDSNLMQCYINNAIDKNPTLSMHVVNLIDHKLSSKAGHVSWHKFESDSDVIKLVTTCSWGLCPSFRDSVRLFKRKGGIAETPLLESRSNNHEHIAHALCAREQ